jgi:hypothetical protein
VGYIAVHWDTTQALIVEKIFRTVVIIITCHNMEFHLQVVDLVRERLGFKTKKALTDFLGVDRSCHWEWEQRLDGKIPAAHHQALLEEAARTGANLTPDDLYGKTLAQDSAA